MQPRTIFHALVFLLFTGALTASTSAAGIYDTVDVPPAKTSIYIGSVTLVPSPLKRDTAAYTANYEARVFPYFFYNEAGQMRIDFSDDQLAKLNAGERVVFTGLATNKQDEKRRIEGHAEAAKPGAHEGKLKVRIFVTEKIQLIFNTTYRFTGATTATPAPPPPADPTSAPPVGT